MVFLNKHGFIIQAILNFARYRVNSNSSKLESYLHLAAKPRLYIVLDFSINLNIYSKST